MEIERRNMQLTGQLILITGATSGIGKALLRKFLTLNNQVIAVGRNPVKLRELASSDSRIIPFACDVSQNRDLERLSDFVKQNHRDTNILINNAGIQFNYHFEVEEDTLDKIEYEVAVNLLAPLKLITLLLSVLQNNVNPAIVNISSGLAIVPKSQAPVYCGTKAGIHIFTRSLRFQLDKIKVFEIIPPVVDTAMTADRKGDKISANQLVEEFIKAFENDRYEVNIGKVKLLRIIHRISPALADRIMRWKS